MAMMHLLSERSPDSIIAEYRLLHELALLTSKNRVVQRNPLNLGCTGQASFLKGRVRIASIPAQISLRSMISHWVVGWCRPVRRIDCRPKWCCNLPVTKLRRGCRHGEVLAPL